MSCRDPNNAKKRKGDEYFKMKKIQYEFLRLTTWAKMQIWWLEISIKP